MKNKQKVVSLVLVICIAMMCYSIIGQAAGADTAIKLEIGTPYENYLSANGEAQYYYFYSEPNASVTYEIYTIGNCATKGNVGGTVSTSGGDGNNFKIKMPCYGKININVSMQNSSDSGRYSIIAKPVLDRPDVTLKTTDEKFILNWNKIEGTASYDVYVKSVLNGSDPLEKTVEVTDNKYELPQTSITKNKLLSFTVRAKLNQWEVGPSSKTVYSKNLNSVWEYEKPMIHRRADFATAVIGKKIYAIGGWIPGYGGFEKSIEEYDTETGKWNVVGEYPRNVTGIDKTAAQVVNGKIYIIGGRDGDKGVKYVEEFDPATKTWTHKAEMETAGYDIPTVVYQDKIILFGGVGRDRKVDMYDPKTNTWTKLTSDIPMDFVVNAIVVNGKIHVFGCLGSWIYCYEYTAFTQNSWKQVGNRYAYNVCQSITKANNKIYLKRQDPISGAGAGHLQSDLAGVYDPLKKTWSELPNENLKRAGASIAAVGNKLYVIGGYDESLGCVDIVESYTLPAAQKETSVLDIVKDEVVEVEIYTNNYIKGSADSFWLNYDKSDLELINPSSFFSLRMIDDNLLPLSFGLKGFNYFLDGDAVGFHVNYSLGIRDSYTGSLNTIKFKAKKTGQTTVTLDIIQ